MPPPCGWTAISNLITTWSAPAANRCRIEGEFIDFKRLSRHLPDGFDLTQPLIEVFGLCRRCSAKK